MGKTRRQFLRIAGSTAVIAAAGAGAFVMTRTPTKAQAPWGMAGGSEYTDPRKRALSYAILAPNSHNQQPWLVTLEGDDAFTLTCDPERLLPETDPFNRQIVVSLGCFLELMRMAAAEDGYRADVTVFPDGEPQPKLDDRPIAHVRLVKDAGAERSPLFAQVAQRRSNKEPYDTGRPVSQASLDAINGVTGEGTITGAITDADEIDFFRELTWQAFKIELETPRTYMESVNVMRIGKAEINANPDGLELGGAMMDVMKLAGIVTHETLADMSSMAYAQGRDMFEPIMRSAMGYAYLVTETNTRADQIIAGRDWVRMNLKATELGIGIHPLSQALQEYPEMDELYRSLHGRLGHSDHCVQMFGRVGYGPEIQPTPRWPLDAKITNA